MFRGNFCFFISTFFSLVFLCEPGYVIGQSSPTGNISGIVYDESTRKPLADANVYLIQIKTGTTTGFDGRFTMSNLPEGNYTLSVSFLGYKKNELKVTIRKDINQNLTIYLKVQLYTKGEVVINATRDNEERETPLWIDIIPVKKIEQAPVMTIAGLLDYVPGINMSNTFGIYSGRAIVTMRGLPANDQSRTLVLLDGAPLNKADEGSVNWNMINKNNIESIKVIKGPGIAQYGSGAMGGVIEITSKKPQKKFAGQAIVGYGTYNTIDANMDLSGSIKDSSSVNGLYWNLSGFGRLSDGYITEPDEYYDEEDTILVPTFLREINASAKVGYDFKNLNNIELKFGYFDDKRGNGVKVFEAYGAFSEHDTFNWLARYSGIGKNFKWNTNIYYSGENYNRIYEYMNEGEYMLYEADSWRNDMGGKFDLTFTGLPKHSIMTGADYKLGTVDGTDTYYTSTDIISNAGKMQTGAIFLQDEIFFFDRNLQINIGFRYDFAKYFDGLFIIAYPSYSIEFISRFEDKAMPVKNWDAFCPRFSAQYKYSESDRIYLSVARGFRAPILDDMTRTGKKKGTFKIANPGLKPELITTCELGADVEIFRDIAFRGSLYYSIGKDFMYYSSTGDSVNMGYKIVPVLTKKNISKVEIYGLETELKYEFNKNLAAFANYAYTHAVVKENVVNDTQVDYDLSGKYLTDVPNHKVTAGITWNNRILNTTLLYKFIGEQWINDQNIVDQEYLFTDKYPACSIYSIRIEKQILKNLKAATSIENLFDKIYTDSNAQQCPGRFIMVMVNFTF
jgi:iron complex outermembrane receptor protein